MVRDLNTGLGVDFQPGAQEGLINSRGVQMIHEIGIACTCRVDDPYAGSIEESQEKRREAFCTRCGQDGWLFRNPSVITGIITGIRHQRNVLDAGNFLPGDSQFSPSVEGSDCKGTQRIGAFDKLTATWPEPLDDGHVLVRGAGSSAALSGIKTELSTNEDRLWYEPANAIWCEDEYGTVYEEDSDFQLGPGKIIKWTGNQPDVGARFSIKYNAYFEWIVWQPPGERRDRDSTNLGELVYLRKRHIIFVNSSPFASSEVRQTIQAKVTTI